MNIDQILNLLDLEYSSWYYFCLHGRVSRRNSGICRILLNKVRRKYVQIGDKIAHMLRACCTLNLYDLSWEGGRGRDGMVGRFFSLFLSGFPKGWIFKGSGLNLRSGIRGQTRIAKQPIFVLFLPASPLYATTSPRRRRRRRWRKRSRGKVGGREITEGVRQEGAWWRCMFP